VWTACDRANVTVVHDVTTHTRLATIPLPRAVARVGGVPHDTISNDRFGYVSYIKNADGAGYVGVYDLVEFSLRRLVKNAADPLIGLFADSDVVLAAQGGMVSTYTQGLAAKRQRRSTPPSRPPTGWPFRPTGSMRTLPTLLAAATMRSSLTASARMERRMRRSAGARLSTRPGRRPTACL